MSLMQVGSVNLYMKTHFIKIPCWFKTPPFRAVGAPRSSESWSNIWRGWEGDAHPFPTEYKRMAGYHAVVFGFGSYLQAAANAKDSRIHVLISVAPARCATQVSIVAA